MTTPDKVHTLYRISTAARALRLSPATLYLAIKKGRLTAVRLDGIMFITAAELERYQKESTGRHTATRCSPEGKEPQ